jgi:hypothetical protein
MSEIVDPYSDEWSNFVKSITIENKEAKEYCDICECKTNIIQLGFIYRTHKFDKGYGNVKNCCNICKNAIENQIISNPSDYDYVGKIVKSSIDCYEYRVDLDYYNNHKEYYGYVSFHINNHWNELSEELKKKYKSYHINDIHDKN